ncbi:hypothetical protein CLIB1444_18S00100 [[Candida] jaroonii]|uniref:Uncharacterized protein n=1 Tax=[Candida] jaroonii TaxID=467808 RepID=A0ACA9YG35_9ASCO|nr:hypothetical protein CLIB1444_18S00100 [[Candida] jaroonii]
MGKKRLSTLKDMKPQGGAGTPLPEDKAKVEAAGNNFKSILNRAKPLPKFIVYEPKVPTYSRKSQEEMDREYMEFGDVKGVPGYKPSTSQSSIFNKNKEGSSAQETVTIDDESDQNLPGDDSDDEDDISDSMEDESDVEEGSDDDELKTHLNKADEWVNQHDKSMEQLNSGLNFPEYVEGSFPGGVTTEVATKVYQSLTHLTNAGQNRQNYKNRGKSSSNNQQNKFSGMNKTSNKKAASTNAQKGGPKDYLQTFSHLGVFGQNSIFFKLIDLLQVSFIDIFSLVRYSKENSFLNSFFFHQKVKIC